MPDKHSVHVAPTLQEKPDIAKLARALLAIAEKKAKAEKSKTAP